NLHHVWSPIVILARLQAPKHVVVVDGKMYWLSLDLEQSGDVLYGGEVLTYFIVCLDVVHETWKIGHSPAPNYADSMCLVVYEDQISCVVNYASRMQLWKLNNDMSRYDPDIGEASVFWSDTDWEYMEIESGMLWHRFPRYKCVSWCDGFMLICKYAPVPILYCELSTLVCYYGPTGLYMDILSGCRFYDAFFSRSNEDFNGLAVSGLLESGDNPKEIPRFLGNMIE
ncbi:hypothetical protein KI387_012514, partial [Taxus chinensis]